MTMIVGLLRTKGPWCALLAASIVFASSNASAQSTGADNAAKAAQRAYQSQSLFGSYLAGRFARTERNSVDAARFYQRALQFDPTNETLVRQAFLMEAANGNWPAVGDLAKRLTRFEPNHRLARLYLGIESFQSGAFTQADTHFKAADSGPISELTSGLARAWTQLAAGNTKAALNRIDQLKRAEWVVYYQRYHRALIAAISGRKKTARTSFEKIFKQEPRTLRVALSYARFLASTGNVKRAKAVVRTHLKASKQDHPLAVALLKELNAGGGRELLITTAEEGLAETLYGLGEAWTYEGGLDVGQVYLRFALKIRPDMALALEALAHVYEKNKRYARAIEAYEQISADHPIGLDTGIQRALNLNLLERVDEAKSVLEELIDRHPDEIRPVAALGNVMRWNKRYDEAITYFTKAIGLSKPLKEGDWSYFYSRAIAYDQVKNWSAAEKDFKTALKLNPDQPQTLNYLGYSWVDRNLHLTKALGMISKAVKLKPDDGYIVDSLGWAHYKLGNFKKAERYLERAVELKPNDPVINDHYGDALWRVGREREARYQWEISLTMKPKPKDAKATKKKLLAGLPSVDDAGDPLVKQRRKKEKRADAVQRVPAKQR